MPVTTRTMIFLVGDPYKPSFATGILGEGGQPKLYSWKIHVCWVQKSSWKKDSDFQPTVGYQSRAGKNPDPVINPSKFHASLNYLVFFFIAHVSKLG